MATQSKAPAPVRPATTWPFPTPKVSEPSISKKKVVTKKPAPPALRGILGAGKGSAADTKKHVVMATLNNVELAKARSALSLDLFADGKKIGNLEVGQGSFFWTGAKRKKSNPIDWSTFASLMNHLAYEKK